jgi:hypothetical protein
MKHHRIERLWRMQREYHRSQPWRLSRGGLFIPHCYEETAPDSLSWWDDVGFILNGRRVMVWWQHPRDVYAAEIEKLAWQEAGAAPGDASIFGSCTKNYRKVGRSRKKIISYSHGQPSDGQRAYYDKVRAIQTRLKTTGVDLTVTPDWKREALAWATGISLIAPLEVRNALELAMVATLARRLLLGQTTLEHEFPGYRYDQADWRREQAVLP